MACRAQAAQTDRAWDRQDALGHGFGLCAEGVRADLEALQQPALVQAGFPQGQSRAEETMQAGGASVYLNLTGNEKMRGSVTFDLPPVKTCPGRSTICEKYCYAMHGRLAFPSVVRRREKLLDFFERTGEIPDLAPFIVPKFVRLFTSGDLYCLELIEAIDRFLHRYPSLPMVAYTRAWRVPELAERLRQLAEIPNLHLWLSADEETGLPERWAPIAYMAVGDKPPKEPVDLVFRALHTNPSVTARRRADRPMLFINGPVCRAQRGIGKKKHCLECGHCFSRPKRGEVAWV